LAKVTIFYILETTEIHPSCCCCYYYG